MRPHPHSPPYALETFDHNTHPDRVLTSRNHQDDHAFAGMALEFQDFESEDGSAAPVRFCISTSRNCSADVDSGKQDGLYAVVGPTAAVATIDFRKATGLEGGRGAGFLYLSKSEVKRMIVQLTRMLSIMCDVDEDGKEIIK